MRRTLGLKLARNSSPEDRASYHKARREILKADPEWCRQQKIRAANYRAGRAVLLRERQREWRDAHPERKKEIDARYTAKHRDRLNAKQREKNKTPERKEFMRQYAPKHRAENADLYRTYAHNRAARRRSGGTHTIAEWRSKLAEHDGRCAYCGADQGITRDHDIPISRGGKNTIDNIVPACGPCNYRKQALTGDEYRARMAVERKAA